MFFKTPDTSTRILCVFDPKIDQTTKIRKEYDPALENYVYNLNTLADKLEIGFKSAAPNFVIIQLCIPSNKPFGIEFLLKNATSEVKKRLVFSQNHPFIEEKSGAIYLPIRKFKRNTWLNVQIDLASILEKRFPADFPSLLELITISAYCKLRKIVFSDTCLASPEPEGVSPKLQERMSSTLNNEKLRKINQSKLHYLNEILISHSGMNFAIENFLAEPCLAGALKTETCQMLPKMIRNQEKKENTNRDESSDKNPNELHRKNNAKSKEKLEKIIKNPENIESKTKIEERKSKNKVKIEKTQVESKPKPEKIQMPALKELDPSENTTKKLGKSKTLQNLKKNLLPLKTLSQKDAFEQPKILSKRPFSSVKTKANQSQTKETLKNSDFLKKAQKFNSITVLNDPEPEKPSIVENIEDSKGEQSSECPDYDDHSVETVKSLELNSNSAQSKFKKTQETFDNEFFEQKELNFSDKMRLFKNSSLITMKNNGRVVIERRDNFENKEFINEIERVLGKEKAGEKFLFDPVLKSFYDPKTQTYYHKI